MEQRALFIIDSVEIFFISEEGELANFANLVKELWPGQGGIGLKGELGAGKTTFVRTMLMQLGVRETIQSPTFTGCHEYELPRGQIDATHCYHWDLYRFAGDNLIFCEIEEQILNLNNLVFIEWPDLISGIDELLSTKVEIILSRIKMNARFVCLDFLNS